MTRGIVPWSRLIGRQIRLVTATFFLGLGLAACSDGSEPEEVVQADENAAQEEAPVSDEVAAADAPQGEGEGDVVAAEAPADGVGGTEEGMQPADAPAEPVDDTASVPAEVVEGESSETGVVDAELTTDGQAPEAQLASAPPMESAVEESLTEDTTQPAATTEPSYEASPYSDGKSISSPGAAKFIKSKTDNGNYASNSNSGGGDASYVVRSGDTLALIAEKIYGTPKFYKDLAQQNGIAAPYRIYPGDEIKFSASNKKSMAFAKKLKGSKKTVKVQAGDTLSSIAAKVFGSAYAWKTLAAYNKDKISNPNQISKGMVLAYVDFGDGAAAEASEDQPKKTKKNKGKANGKVKAGKPIKNKATGKKKAPITNEDLGE